MHCTPLPPATAVASSTPIEATAIYHNQSLPSGLEIYFNNIADQHPNLHLASSIVAAIATNQICCNVELNPTLSQFVQPVPLSLCVVMAIPVQVHTSLSCDVPAITIDLDL
ncbi:hypothetical protein U1Q18_052720 [Sarracenia purpurea var. burkii]